MTERIDHVAAAIDMVHAAQAASNLESIRAIALGAQVHATLAMVEQQRTANLIALGRTGRVAPSPIFNEQLSAFDLDSPQTLRTEIREALGL